MNPKAETVTEQVAVLLPSAVVTVMVAVPVELPAVIVPFKPLPDIDATLASLDCQLTDLLSASPGVMEAVSVAVPLGYMDSVSLSRVTPVTDLGASTVTEQVAVLLPSVVVTVMLAVPVELPAVIVPFKPLPDIDATLVSLDCQLTDLFVASPGVIAAVKVAVPLADKVRVVLSRVTPVTFTGLTVTEQVAE
jgi:hypothetical protein